MVRNWRFGVSQSRLCVSQFCRKNHISYISQWIRYSNQSNRHTSPFSHIIHISLPATGPDLEFKGLGIQKWWRPLGKSRWSNHLQLCALWQIPKYWKFKSSLSRKKYQILTTRSLEKLQHLATVNTTNSMYERCRQKISLASCLAKPWDDPERICRQRNQ